MTCSAWSTLNASLSASIRNGARGQRQVHNSNVTRAYRARPALPPLVRRFARLKGVRVLPRIAILKGVGLQPPV